MEGNIDRLIEITKTVVAHGLEANFGFDITDLQLTFLNGRRGAYAFGTRIGMEDDHVDIQIIVYDFNEEPKFINTYHLGVEDITRIVRTEGESCRLLFADIEKHFGVMAFIRSSFEESFERMLAVVEYLKQDHPSIHRSRFPYVYDKETGMLLGASTYKAVIRSFAAASALLHYWSIEFPSHHAPLDMPLGIVRVNSLPILDENRKPIRYLTLEEAFKYPELKDTPEELRELGMLILGLESTEQRLSEIYSESLPQNDSDATTFLINVFGLIRVAYKYMKGAFSNDFGSSLALSNIDIIGNVHDLETFQAERVWTGSVVGHDIGNSISFKEFGDGKIDMKYFLEDIRLGFEALERYLQIYGTYEPQFMTDYIIEAWRWYTGKMLISEDTRRKIMQLVAEPYSKRNFLSTLKNMPTGKYASLASVFLSQGMEGLNHE